MNFTLNYFHDAELNRLVHDRLAFTASLVFRTEDSTDMEITFGGVCGLRVVDYGLHIDHQSDQSHGQYCPDHTGESDTDSDSQ